MQSQLINLLPPERVRRVRQEYFIRLATVIVVMLAAVVVSGAVLLAPSYLFVHQDIQTHQAEIANLDGRLAASTDKEAGKRLTTLASDATYLSRLASTTTSVAALRAVLAVPHSGITLNAFTFNAPNAPAPGKMMLTGMAATRETLRAYVGALGALPFVSSVDLPISAYAKESAIPFTITLTGTLRP